MNSICKRVEGRQRLLVPVKDDRTKDRFSQWLSMNAQFWNAEIKILSILEPLWFNDIPYTAARAHQLVDEQSIITAQVRRDRATYCEKLRKSFEGICLSSDVCEGHVNATTILDYARNWQADCILLLSTKKNPLRELLRLSLAAQVLREADCMVLVIQAPDSQKPGQIERRHPSTT